MQHLGAGPAPIPRKELGAERLEHAIRQTIADAAMKGCAAEIGRQIRSEDGVGRAVALFQRHIGARAGLPISRIMPARAA